jgi:glycosyltransferase involved in cell wall biosynthesis
MNDYSKRKAMPNKRNPPESLFILKIAPTPFYSGRGTHMRIFHEANALAERGHHVMIVTYHNGDHPDGLHPNITIKRINRLLFWYTKRSSGPNWQKIILDLLLFVKVMRISIRTRPDVLHCHLHEGILIGWMLKKASLCRNSCCIGDLHGTLVAEMRVHGYLRFRPVQQFFKWIEKTIHRMPCRVFLSSPGLKPYVDKDRRTPDASVLPDAPTLAHDHAWKAGNTSEIPRSNNVPCIVYTGGFTPDKGIDALFQIIAVTLKNGLYCRWVIAGGPAHRLKLPAAIRKSVTVVSPLDNQQLVDVLKRADIGCEPKDVTTFQSSGKLLNYMYAGLPTVCFDGPAQRFYLGEELASILIAKDIKHFCDILNHLIQMPSGEKARLKNRILQRAKQFTWEQSARQLERCYLEQWGKERKRKLVKSEL